jgi:starch synthase (maltosyl-transferring)
VVGTASPPATASPTSTPRVVIETVAPAVDGGRYPVKRIAGDRVEVTADIFTDSHDAIGAVVRHRHAGDTSRATTPWSEVGMRRLSNDRWAAEFTVDTLGTHEFIVAAWIDDFGTWRKAVRARHATDRVTDRDLQDGAVVIRDALTRTARHDVTWLDARARLLEAPGPTGARVTAGLADELRSRMARIPPHHGVATSAPHRVHVERSRARFGAWYEMFPRSAGTDATRSATFGDAAARLPDIAAMGFDVVYLPPIHPIGITDRKGRGGDRPAAAGDPGSPWAIGGPAGGHFAVEPGLGTLADFDRFVASARDLGLEIALDLAFHCSPDHPYVREHPEWFPRRADGTLRRGENPPKRYDDICPFRFDGLSAPSLYAELHRIVAFWIGRGVRIFRVDNPHTKPFAFWEWLLATVRRDHPDVVFLAEAFTRQKVMLRLAKLGFSQSYTYFLWRHSKFELTSHLEELAAAPTREYLRPNLFVNTPDVLPTCLQTGGRQAFELRLVLAATLGASYGMYSGFELCDNEAIPGREEYQHSEKFEYRVRDWNRPGHIKPLLTALNRIRRAHPALQTDAGLRFHETDDDTVICYSKVSGDRRDIVCVAVALDPGRVRTATIEIPREAWAIAADRALIADDLLDGSSAVWHGARQTVEIDPTVRPARVWRIAPVEPPLDRSRRKVLQ